MLFYSIASVIISIILIAFGVVTLKTKKKILFSVLTFIHAAFILGFGILGFFLLGTEYEPIPLLSLLAFSLTYIIIILVLYMKEPKTK